MGGSSRTPWLLRTVGLHAAQTMEPIVTSPEGPNRLAACRAQARRLLKQLRSIDPTASAAAAERFLRLRSFSASTGSDVVQDRQRVHLKHALAVIAEENGHESWSAMKMAYESAAPLPAPLARSASTDEGESARWHVRGMDAFLNRWFSKYEDAQRSLQAEGGYLLPYRNQFFVCEAEAIRLLGLDPLDPDWERIGWDGVHPADPEAYVRLRDHRKPAD
jgi:hypothetical protein